MKRNFSLIVLAGLINTIASVSFGAVADEGGFLISPKSFKGRAVILNAQTDVAHNEIVTAAATLAKYSECNVVVEKTEIAQSPVEAKKTLSADLLIIVVADETTPAMLIAPEDNWGYVNVLKLTDDLKSKRSKEKFSSSRARKEIIRAFSLLAGGGSSQFDGNLMNAHNIRETDYMDESIPVDMISYWQRHLKAIGITKKVVKTYLDACEEGWAPAPTNEYQKAIWDKVHAAPKNPMKIEFDPKKGR
jgi:hypothetical protein